MSCRADYSFVFWSGSADYYFELNGTLYLVNYTRYSSSGILAAEVSVAQNIHSLLKSLIMIIKEGRGGGARRNIIRP
jgi:hypothetical protein